MAPMNTTHPLRLWRTNRGLRLADICAKLDIHPGYLSELERGLKVPSLQLAEKIRLMTKNRVKPQHFMGQSTA